MGFTQESNILPSAYFYTFSPASNSCKSSSGWVSGLVMSRKRQPETSPLFPPQVGKYLTAVYSKNPTPKKHVEIERAGAPFSKS